MKYLKYALIILLFSVVFELILVKAYSAPIQMSIIRELDKNNLSWTNYYTKNTWTLQTYFNSKAYTWMTNPCSECYISTRMYTEDGDFGTEHISAPGQTKKFNENTSLQAPNNYRLAIKRSNITALSTHHEGIWKIN